MYQHLLLIYSKYLIVEKFRKKITKIALKQTLIFLQNSANINKSSRSLGLLLWEDAFFVHFVITQ